MIRRLRTLLEGRRGVQWEIRGTRDQEHQLYHVGPEPEAIRQVEDHAWEVRLHHRHPGPDSEESEGSATLFVHAWESDSELVERIEAALAQASLVHHRPRDLPAPADRYPQVDCCAECETGDPQAALEAAAQEILRAVSAEPDVEASHFELTLRLRELRQVTSAGIDLESRSSLCTLYGVLVARDHENRLDFKLEARRRQLADLELPRATTEACRFARDSLRAELPRTGTYPVMVSHSALDYLLDPIKAHSDGAFHLNGLARFQPDQPILEREPRGDRLTILSDGLLPMGTASGRFSAEGLPAQCHRVIDQGVLRTILCNSELAARLGRPATGPWTNLVVAPGDTALADLTTDGPVLHVVEFSSFMPDRVTGDMMGEIRLAYEHHQGRCRPIRGGAVSGNLFQALEDLTLSREETFRGSYQGPAAYRFGSLIVAGT